MKAIKTTVLAAAVLLTASSAFAAKPTSIKYIEDIVVDDNDVYSHYVVNCSNGQTRDITAWDNRKSWCIGKGSKTDCSRKQIKAAKKVCKKA